MKKKKAKKTTWRDIVWDVLCKRFADKEFTIKDVRDELGWPSRPDRVSSFVRFLREKGWVTVQAEQGGKMVHRLAHTSAPEPARPAKRGDLSDRVWSYLVQHGPLISGELAEATGLKLSSVSSLCSIWRKRGRVRKLRHGKYEAIGSGPRPTTTQVEVEQSRKRDRKVASSFTTMEPVPAGRRRLLRASEGAQPKIKHWLVWSITCPLCGIGIEQQHTCGEEA